MQFFEKSLFLILEQAGNLAGLGVDVDAAVGRVGCRAGHHGDGAGHRAEELRAAVLENVADGARQPLGSPFLVGSSDRDRWVLTIMVQ